MLLLFLALPYHALFLSRPSSKSLSKILIRSKLEASIRVLVFWCRFRKCRSGRYRGGRFRFGVLFRSCIEFALQFMPFGKQLLDAFSGFFWYLLLSFFGVIGFRFRFFLFRAFALGFLSLFLSVRGFRFLVLVGGLKSCGQFTALAVLAVLCKSWCFAIKYINYFCR